MKTPLTLVAVLMIGSLFLAGPVLAEEQKDTDGIFKGFTKAEHVAVFPQGHPGTNSLNKCIWDEESALYFCQYDAIKTR